MGRQGREQRHHSPDIRRYRVHDSGDAGRHLPRSARGPLRGALGSPLFGPLAVTPSQIFISAFFAFVLGHAIFVVCTLIYGDIEYILWRRKHRK
jgi:hypothetical protein